MKKNKKTLQRVLGLSCEHYSALKRHIWLGSLETFSSVASQLACKNSQGLFCTSGKHGVGGLGLDPKYGFRAIHHLLLIRTGKQSIRILEGEITNLSFCGLHITILCSNSGQIIRSWRGSAVYDNLENIRCADKNRNVFMDYCANLLLATIIRTRCASGSVNQLVSWGQLVTAAYL